MRLHCLRCGHECEHDYEDEVMREMQRHLVIEHRDFLLTIRPGGNVLIADRVFA